jgi:hypothetical protein
LQIAKADYPQKSARSTKKKITITEQLFFAISALFSENNNNQLQLYCAKIIGCCAARPTVDPAEGFTLLAFHSRIPQRGPFHPIHG